LDSDDKMLALDRWMKESNQKGNLLIV